MVFFFGMESFIIFRNILYGCGLLVGVSCCFWGGGCFFVIFGEVSIVVVLNFFV